MDVASAYLHSTCTAHKVNFMHFMLASKPLIKHQKIVNIELVVNQTINQITREEHEEYLSYASKIGKHNIAFTNHSFSSLDHW